MKNPVLSIKKGAQTYDDNEADHLTRPPAPRPSGGRGRPSGRLGRMTFLPLLVLALALVVVARVLPRAPTNRAVIAGWDATLRAVPYHDTLLVSVTFVQESSATATAPSEDAPLAAVRIVLPDTGQEISLSGILGKSPITLRGQMEYSERVKKVQAEVRIGEEQKTLRLSSRTRNR
jgi:hypothetical protein